MSRIDRLARTWRVPTAWIPAVVVAILIAGCSAAPGPAPTGTNDAGFPLGSFSKDLDDPMNGRVRVVWTFAADGRFTEVQLARDGQRLDLFPIRGRFTADGETVTIATTWPPNIGTATHGWRLDGDRLWTFLVESDNPEDKDWFEGLDSRPWEPFQS